MGPTTKTSDEISIICLFRLILQANTCFVLNCGIRVASNSYVHSISFSSGFSTYGSVMIYYGIHSFIFVRMFIVKTICCNFYPLILLIYLSIKMLTDVTLFRMAPPTRQNPDRNEGSQANPPPPPPPPEAWQAIMAATNANAQMILQLLQERTQGQGNQGQGNN